MEREVHVGDKVIFHDEKGVEQNALVICVFDPYPGHREKVVNVAVIAEEGHEDSYGRQIRRETSVPHSSEGLHGFCWRLDSDPEPEYKAPIET